MDWLVYHLFNLDDCLAFVTNRSAKIFAETLEKEFRPYHMTRSQWIAMYYIYKNESITQRELADKLSIKEPSVVRMLQKMELEGHLRREGIQSDKRIKQLELTDKGVKICLSLMPIAEKFKNETIAGISEQDLRIFKNVLNKMVENASAEKS
ncbi:MarR family transcriptional regulator [Paenibacillus sp. UMB4589-SE434]|nr:MarR family transcriptional regulator [Paenibacillus sp. UMB4589-SE434]